MTSKSPSAVYVVPDKMGGVANVIGNLLRYRKPDNLHYHLLLTHNLSDTDDQPIPEKLIADSQDLVYFERSLDNLESIFRRVYHHIPTGEGLVIANDWVELAALTRRDCGRTLLQILHSDSGYYYDLAAQYETVIDGFITYTRIINRKLRSLLPHRRESIFHLPYGVAIPACRRRRMKSGPIRLLFVGRLVESKGVFELPSIDKELLAHGVEAQWTVVGSGPDGEVVKDRWHDPRICWTGALANAQVLPLYREHDVLVLPTRIEGFPVCLLEAMAAGVVPVVSNIPGGIQEVVLPGATGYQHNFLDVTGFAASIGDLHRNRAKLEQMSEAARQITREEFDIRHRVLGYQDLYARWRELRRPGSKGLNLVHGSRLDRSWIPNWAVRMIRKTLSRTAHAPGRRCTRGAACL